MSEKPPALSRSVVEIPTVEIPPQPVATTVPTAEMSPAEEIPTAEIPPPAVETTVPTAETPARAGAETTIAPETAEIPLATLETTPPTQETPTPATLSGRSREIYGSLNEGGKTFAASVFETLHKIPVVNRIVGKMEIAFKQFFINHHEKKATDLRVELDTFDRQISGLQDAKMGSLEMIEQIKRDGGLGSEKILLQIKIYDKKIAEAEAKRDKIQAETEERQNKILNYTNKRDQIADELIGNYEQKISPLERRLEDLDTQRAEMDLEKQLIEIENEEKKEKINELVEKRRKIERSLENAGFSERQIQKNPAIKEFDRQILEIENCIRNNRAEIKTKEIELSAEIAKVDQKANPYRDKRDEFVRLKQGRPIDLGIETRTRAENPDSTENARGHTRTESPVESYLAEEESPVESAPTERAEKENNPEKIKKTIREFVSKWNEFIKNDARFNGIKEINLNDFIDNLKKRRSVFGAEKQLTAKQFSAILGLYYKIIKSSRQELPNALNHFISTLK
jgi:hypothetical protein